MPYNKFANHIRALIGQLVSPILFTDADGFLLWANESFLNLTGYTLEEILGQKPGAFLQGPDTDPETVKVMSKALKSQKGFVVEVLNYTKDGKSYMAKGKDIKLILDLEDNFKVRADEDMLDIVLRNLCSNAIKFCTSGCEVRLKAEAKGDFVRIAVVDDGPGIPEDVVDRIFETNYSTPGSANEKGSGLGLSLCNRFIQMHKAKLQLQSAEGQGARFYFDLKAV